MTQQIYSSGFAIKLFIHRLTFMVARAIAISGVPIVFLVVGGNINDEGFSIIWLIEVIIGIIVPLLPIISLKTIFKMTCPACGAKLDREIIGAANYECESCDCSFS